MLAILAVLFVGDHPRLLRRYRTQVINLDRAITDETALRAHLERLLGATVHQVKVRKVDLVNDTTNVEVRFRLPASEPDRPPTGGSPTATGADWALPNQELHR